MLQATNFIPNHSEMVFTANQTIDWIFTMTSKTSMTVTSFLILAMKIFSGHCLTCHRAEYVIGNECCPKCLPGSRVKTDCTEFRSTSCLACLDGTYMDQPTGLKYCLSCTNCETGSGLRIKTSCRTTSDAVCEPLDGFYCVDSTENSCVRATKHRSCGPGQYVSSKGTASSDTLCSRCPDGTFSDGTLTLCRPHTQCESENLQLIKAGNATADAECGEKSLNQTGIVVGVVVVVISILGAVSFIVYKNKKKTNLNPEQSAESQNQEPLNAGEDRNNASVQQKDTTALIQTCDEGISSIDAAADLQTGSLSHPDVTD